MKCIAPASAGETFDYVIVGGGSAGSAIAARLNENGRHTVLFLEAGKDDRWIWLRVPLGAGRVLLSERSLWRFYTEPERHMGGRRMYWPRGRVLGGSGNGVHF
jgi:choline dehydrogenase